MNSTQMLSALENQLNIFHQQLKKILSKNGQGVSLCHKELRE